MYVWLFKFYYSILYIYVFLFILILKENLELVSLEKHNCKA